ncbi:hypothetical protein ACMFMG_006871 [Clarireedia jacksonii]
MAHQQETPKHASGKHLASGSKTASLPRISEEGDSNYMSDGNGSRSSSKSRHTSVKWSASKGKKAAGNTKVTNKDSELHHQYKEARDAVLATLADRAKTRVPTSQTRLGESLSLPKFADRKNGSNVPLMTDEWVWNEHVLAHLISEAQAEWAKFDTLVAQFKAHYKGTSAEQRAMNVDRGIRKQYENYVTCNDCAIPDKRARQCLMQLLYAKQYGKEEIGGQLLQVMEDLVEIDNWMKRFDDAIPNHAVAGYKKLLGLAGAKCNHQHEKLKSQAKAKKGAKLEDSGPSDIEMDVLGKPPRLV